MLFHTGNMWGQAWGNIYDLLEPFPNKTAIDFTPELLRQVSHLGVVVKRIVRITVSTDYVCCQ